MTQLVRGQKVRLSDLGAEGKSLDVSANLTFPSGGVQSLDLGCFGLDAAGKLSDERYFIFYNQKESPCKSVKMTGSGDFQVTLTGLPATIQRLVFTAVIDGSPTMNQLGSGILRLRAGGQVVAEFQLSAADFGTEKAVMLAELYQKDVWRFAAVGQGFNGGLDALLRSFGGQVAEDKPKAPPPPPAPPYSPPAQPKPAAAPPPLPAAVPPTLSLKKLTLEKQGERKKISLTKGGSSQAIHINLNWDRLQKKSFFGGKKEADLDLGCMFITRDGQAGCIQALGGNFGNRNGAPYIFLDKDDRSGQSSDGENLWILRPENIEKVLVFAFIYEGIANFGAVNGRLTMKELDGSETLIRLDSPISGATFCAICLISNKGDSIDVTKETRYFTGHRDADHHYGFGFNWRAGSK